MTVNKPRRRWGTDRQLEQLLEAQPGGTELAARDFALLTLAAQLSTSFPGQLVFKGGFVLRHVHGLLRFSKDVDATRTEPAGHKLESDEVALAIERASIRDCIRFTPNEPATDSARSLDFDRIEVRGGPFPHCTVQVEVSYREGVEDPPQFAHVGEPFYENFELLAMSIEEMAAEKLRTLAQRSRPTDLADLAVLLERSDGRDDHIAELAAAKFELVAAGRANRIERIRERLADMADDYDDTVQNLFPEAPNYDRAMEIVWPRIHGLVP